MLRDTIKIEITSPLRMMFNVQLAVSDGPDHAILLTTPTGGAFTVTNQSARAAARKILEMCGNDPAGMVG